MFSREDQRAFVKKLNENARIHADCIERLMAMVDPSEIIDDGEARARQAAMVAAKAELVAAGTVATAVDAAIDAYNEARR